MYPEIKKDTERNNKGFGEIDKFLNILVCIIIKYKRAMILLK